MKTLIQIACILGFTIFVFQSNVSAQSENQSIISIKRQLLGKTPVPNYDSVLYWYLDGEEWKYSQRQRNYIYDTENNLLEYINEIFENGNWLNERKYVSTYNGNNITSELTQFWENNAWKNAYLIEHEYYLDDSIKKQTFSIWNSIEWELYNGISYEYYPDSNYKKEMFFYSNSSEYTQVNYYYYNEINQLIQKISWTWNGTALARTSRTDYEYDQDGFLISSLSQLYVDDELVPDNKWAHVYTDGHLIEQIYQDWNGIELQNNIRFTYQYDTQDNMYYAESFFWSESGWVKDAEGYFTYDPNNFLTSEVSKYYMGSEIVSTDSTHYYYQTPLGIDETRRRSEKIDMYPNPSTGLFTVISNNQIIEVEVFDMSGELIYYNSYQASRSQRLDLTNFRNGTYLIRLNKSESGRLLKVSKSGY